MKASRLARKESLTAALLIAPSVLALALVAFYPLVAAAWLSLHRAVLVFHEKRFVGLANYRFLLRDPRFWSALANTAYFTLVSVVLELLLGLSFALLLHRRFRGRGLARAIVLLPWAFPSVVAASMWSWLFNPDYGLITKLLPGKEINWLGTPGYAMHAAIVADVWKTTPFMALLLLGGLQMIPGDLYQAAQIDGASAFRIFRAITLPLLVPMMAVALVFRTLDAFRVIDIIYVMTGGGPANTTESLSIYGYKMLVRIGDFGYGSTLAVATFLAVVGIAAIYLVCFRKALGER